MVIVGLHHISLVCSNARRTIDFYTQILGMRLVKQIKKAGNPSSYHFYLADATGRPGTILSFAEWRGARCGQSGIGGLHHLALHVPSYAVLLQWKTWLLAHNIPVDGPFDRRYYHTLSFKDPDGLMIELATFGPGWDIDEAPHRLGRAYRTPPPHLLVGQRDLARIEAEIWPEPVTSISDEMALRSGLHHVTAISSDISRTHTFLASVLGLRRVKMTINFDNPASAHWYWGVDRGNPGTLISYIERSLEVEPHMRLGTGQSHHLAFAVPDEDSLLAWRERLISVGVPVSQIFDQIYFKGMYLNDPDGYMIELATLGPGFTIDESEEELGSKIREVQTPEADRTLVTAFLRPIVSTYAGEEH